MRGIVERIQRDRQRAFIRGNDGREFSVEPQELRASFEDLSLGARVEFQENGEHARAVQVVSETLDPPRHETATPEKAAKPDVAAALSQVPPKAATGNEVDEASWESFPASDAPAQRRTT